MSTSTLAARQAGTRAATSTSTRSLLRALALSSPLWAIISLAQVATREGSDLARYPLSMLSIGSLGWHHITNFRLRPLNRCP